MTLKYASKAQYIAQSPQAQHLTPKVKSAMELIVVKRNGIYSIRKTKPNKNNPSAQAVFMAMDTAKHTANWGDLNSWNESQTYSLMLMKQPDRDLFDSALDCFNNAFKAALGPKWGRNWGG